MGIASNRCAASKRGAASESWAGRHKILVIRLDNIGDVVMLGPSLRCLKETLPQATLTLLASPAGAKIAPLLPWVDEVIVHEALWQSLDGGDTFFSEMQYAFIDQLRARNFDAAIIFTSFSQSPYPAAYACFLAGIPVRVGQSKEFGGAVLTDEIKPPPDETHQVDRNLFLLRALGFEPSSADLALTVPEEDQRTADCRLQAVGVDSSTPYVVFAPGASCAARRYDLERAAVVARQLPQQTGLPVVIVGSSGEQEMLRPLAAGGDEHVKWLVGRTSIPELAGIIRHAALVITNNSGPMHIADALQRPLIVLYSGTELEEQWRPRGSAATLLNRPVPCSPCYRFTCPYDMACLDVPPSQIIDEALRFLKRPHAAPRVENDLTHLVVT